MMCSPLLSEIVDIIKESETLVRIPVFKTILVKSISLIGWFDHTKGFSMIINNSVDKFTLQGRNETWLSCENDSLYLLYTFVKMFEVLRV